MTDERIQHDPRTKSQIKDILYNYLYEPVERKFKQRLEAIITRNTAIIGASHKSFTYKGQFYTCDPSPAPRKMNRLVPQLHADMDEYLADLKVLNDQEVPYVLGFITQTLNASNDLHDYLMVFPESVHAPIMKIIETCPCRTKRLTPEEAEILKSTNTRAINLMKQRLMANLII